MIEVLVNANRSEMQELLTNDQVVTPVSPNQGSRNCAVEREDLLAIVTIKSHGGVLDREPVLSCHPGLRDSFIPAG